MPYSFVVHTHSLEFDDILTHWMMPILSNFWIPGQRTDNSERMSTRAEWRCLLIITACTVPMNAICTKACQCELPKTKDVILFLIKFREYLPYREDGVIVCRILQLYLAHVWETLMLLQASYITPKVKSTSCLGKTNIHQSHFEHAEQSKKY